MKTQILKKLSAICLVLLISGAAWACGGKGGSCGDKGEKKTAVLTAHCDAENKESCGKKESCDKKDACDKKAEGQGGCKGAGGEKKACPAK